MKNRTLALAGAALLPALSCNSTPAGCNQSGEKRPNVVMFLIDDLGWTDFACYGSLFYQTPAIDSLARAGVRFTDAYAACTVSSPTRAALMSGKYPARLHLTDWIAGQNFAWAKLRVPEWTKYLPLEEKTIAEYLRDEGYQTWHVGKWHLGDDEIYWPENQGYDVNIGGNFKGAPIRNGIYGGYFAPYGLKRLEEGRDGEYLTDRLTDEAVRLIENRRDDKPFYLNMAHYAVHTPLGAKPELEKKYEALADSSYFQNNATYAAMIESVDQSLAAIMRALDRNGLMDNTLIVLTTDNGSVHNISRNYPLRRGKGSEYEGGVRVPMIMYWKGHTFTGATEQTPVITMDIFSTILDAAGVKVRDREVDGKSLCRLAFPRGASEASSKAIRARDKAAAKLADRPLFWHYPHYHNGGARPYSSVRQGEWKLIHQYETDTWELYNLREDIGETKNLVGENGLKFRELADLLENWLDSVDAQYAAPNPDYDPARERKKGAYKGLE
ncbi:MAG: sulfatase [Bacteroidales bacterium]|nr:sulfatase [Bacteroidales bacterium]